LNRCTKSSIAGGGRLPGIAAILFLFLFVWNLGLDLDFGCGAGRSFEARLSRNFDGCAPVHGMGTGGRAWTTVIRSAVALPTYE